jgi:hypothetical protein
VQAVYKEPTTIYATLLKTEISISVTSAMFTYYIIMFKSENGKNIMQLRWLVIGCNIEILVAMFQTHKIYKNFEAVSLNFSKLRITYCIFITDKLISLPSNTTTLTA